MEIYRTAAIKLKDVRTAIATYNKLAMENHLYMIGISDYDEISMAESGIPRDIVDDVRNRKV